LRRDAVLFTTIIEQSIETALPEIERCGHEFTMSLPSEMIYLNADAVRLAQVFSNLLNNACKYTRTPGGHIGLCATAQGSEVAVTVKDNGIGIAPENLTHIFDMFAQPSSAYAPGGGLGIGLALAKGLVEMHGGRIEARSDGVGKGSEFVLRIPILDRRETHAERTEERETAHAVDCHRVLVVDDNRDSAQSLATLLRLHGQEVAVGYDGDEALHKALEFQPDLVLLDIGMPNVNGYDACRMIREQPRNKDVMMVALTGWGQDEDRRKSKQAGFDAHLVKPVDYGVLVELLGSIRRDREND
jgi:CheY-like chemotaxis protein